MAQITGTLYNGIADDYASIQTSLDGIQTSARASLNDIIDVDTATYPQVSTADADAALEIELALLAPFNSAQIAAGTIQNSTSSLMTAVRALNDFVITNQDHSSVSSGTAKEKLDYFINTQMADYWTLTFCPPNWAVMSASGGYNTDDWVIS